MAIRVRVTRGLVVLDAARGEGALPLMTDPSQKGTGATVGELTPCSVAPQNYGVSPLSSRPARFVLYQAPTTSC
jgi:hypothetical protein